MGKTTGSQKGSSSGSHAMVLAFLIAVLIAMPAYLVSDEISRILNVGSAFTAKNICSAVFVSRRSTDDILQHELSGLAAAIYGFEIDEHNKVAQAFVWNKAVSKLLGFPDAIARYHGRLGCHFDNDESVKLPVFPEDENYVSDDVAIKPNNRIQEILDWQVTEAALKRNQTRATAVMHDGVLVGESYQTHLGISHKSKLLGWSMTKTVHTMIIGAAIQQGKLTVNTPVQFDYMPSTWKNYLLQRNDGKNVTFGDIIKMSDVLPCPENYGIPEFVPHMLFASNDHGEFVSQCAERSIGKFTKTRNVSELSISSKGKVEHDSFDWYYSSAVSNLLAKEFRRLFHNHTDYLQFPFRNLFDKIGATSFTLDTDPSGTFVASSFAYGTARDWAKLGQLLLNRGRWGDEQVIPESFVDFMLTPHPNSAGHYGGSIWLNPARVSVSQYNYLPANHPDKVRFTWITKALPSDTALMSGFDGQYVAIIPSLRCVIVRLGFTPGNWDDPDIPREKIPFLKDEFFGSIARECGRMLNSDVRV